MTEVACGYYHSCMVTLDGAVHGCGDNSSGMIERVSDLLVLDDLPAGHARKGVACFHEGARDHATFFCS